MALLLNIDTALETASVGITLDGQLVAMRENSRQMDHAGWLHGAIKELMSEAGKELQELQAIAVTIGPGSYTGLRVGLSAAKGICYALNIPLIAINTLKVMAFAALTDKDSLICPLIDARRMEVYTAVYDNTLTEILPPAAMNLDENSFDRLLTNQNLIFVGSGSKKLQSVLNHLHATWLESSYSAAHLGKLGEIEYEKKNFADLAYTEPLYIKDFFSVHN